MKLQAGSRPRLRPLSLPYPDEVFTCAVMTGLFGFISDPLKALSEVRRVFAGGGRFVLFTGSKELRGTPAAPEPMASRLHSYEDQELEELARKAGFDDARVERPDFEQFARDIGIPEEHLELFRGRRGRAATAHTQVASRPDWQSKVAATPKGRRSLARVTASPGNERVSLILAGCGQALPACHPEESAILNGGRRRISVFA